VSNRTDGKRLKAQARQRSGHKAPRTWWTKEKRDRRVRRWFAWADWRRAAVVTRWIDRKFGWSWRWIRRAVRRFKRKRR
jgi:hypothetical protein